MDKTVQSWLQERDGEFRIQDIFAWLKDASTETVVKIELATLLGSLGEYEWECLTGGSDVFYTTAGLEEYMSWAGLEDEDMPTVIEKQFAGEAVHFLFY